MSGTGPGSTDLVRRNADIMPSGKCSLRRAIGIKPRVSMRSFPLAPRAQVRRGNILAGTQMSMGSSGSFA